MHEASREDHLIAFVEHASRAPEPAPRQLVRPNFAEESLAERLNRLRDDPRAVAGALAVVALVAGVFFYRSALATGGDTAAAPGAVSPAASTSTAPTEVVVHVSGAVGQSGVYRLPGGARVSDAVDAAGGAHEGADLDRLNLAALLADGQRVHVPRLGEPMPEGVNGGSGTAEQAGPVSLNLATAEQLEELPGVGPSLAQAILAERQRRGGFRSVDDLLEVRGIGDKRLADLRPLVTV